MHPRSCFAPSSALSAFVVAAAALCALVASLAPSLAQAGINQWTTNGPYGGIVSLLVTDRASPGHLYAEGNGIIFKSSDGGASWAQATTGISDLSVQSLAVDPVNPSTLYAGTRFGGSLLKSTDGGANWAPLAAGPTLAVAIAVDPVTPATIYVAQDQNGLRKSVDGGATWNGLFDVTLPAFPTFKALAVDPKTPSTVYAGDVAHGIFKSVDGGVHWAPATGGITGPIISVLGFAIDPVTPATLYAVLETSGGDGVFKTVDGGASWTRILAPAASNNFAFIGSVGLDPQAPSTIYVGTGNGVFRSIDGGATFTQLRTGLPSAFIPAVVVDPLTSGHVFAATTNGVYTTLNAGAAWTAANNGLALTFVSALAMHPAFPATIYAGTLSSGIFKSVDAGNSWDAINTGVGPTGNGACALPGISAIVIDPQAPSIVYASTQCTASSGVIKSVNGGTTWTVASTGLPEFLDVTALTIDPANSRHLIAGTPNNVVFISNDSGATWTHASAGLPASTGISALAYGTKVPSLWAAVQTINGDTFANSADGGSTWSLTYPGFDMSSGLIAVINFLRNTIGIPSVNLLRNPAFLPPFGASLPTIVGVDLSFCLPVTTLLADPAAASNSYVGLGCGVLKGTNDGALLTAMNAGMPANPGVNALIITPAGDRLYAATSTGGVYVFSTGAKVGVVTEFYNTILDNYFITADPIEAAAIDSGSAGPGWTRTGSSFNFNSGGDTYVCRFYGSITPGPNSHFYTASRDECNGLKALQSSTPASQPRWNFESLDFQSRVPAGGSCPAGTVPVYRAYNNGFNRHIDSNHRITPNQSGIDAVVARGWVSEGVVMCAPGG